MENESYVGTRVAAAYIGCEPDTLRRYARMKLVPATRTPGGQYRFYLPDLVLALHAIRRPRATGGEGSDLRGEGTR